MRVGWKRMQQYRKQRIYAAAIHERKRVEQQAQTCVETSQAMRILKGTA